MRGVNWQGSLKGKKSLKTGTMCGRNVKFIVSYGGCWCGFKCRNILQVFLWSGTAEFGHSRNRGTKARTPQRVAGSRQQSV